MQSLVVAVKECVGALKVSGKCGKSILQPTIQNHLTRLGFEVDDEDRGRFLGARLPGWRSKDTRDVVVPVRRLKIDLVVRQNGKVIGLIETESDLDDLKPAGVSGRSGHYDVYSIARNTKGEWFHSYKSLERMAAALWYDAGLTEDALSSVQSDDPAIHNPKGLDCILVTGRCRPADREILTPRLTSLGATLITAS